MIAPAALCFVLGLSGAIATHLLCDGSHPLSGDLFDKWAGWLTYQECGWHPVLGTILFVAFLALKIPFLFTLAALLFRFLPRPYGLAAVLVMAGFVIASVLVVLTWSLEAHA